MTLANEVAQLAATAKHNRPALADIEWRPLLLAVGERLDLLEQLKYAPTLHIDRDVEMSEYAKITVEFTVGPDTFATLMGLLAE